MDPENRAAINRDGVSVWLDVPLDEILLRIPADGRRPLAADREQMARLFALRQASYEHAHQRLDARRAPVGELVERVVEWLEEA
jgi:shikimate kinase